MQHFSSIAKIIAKYESIAISIAISIAKSQIIAIIIVTVSSIAKIIAKYGNIAKSIAKFFKYC